MQQGPKSDGASQRVRTGSTDCQFHCKGEKGAGTSEGRQDRKGVFSGGKYPTWILMKITQWEEKLMVQEIKFSAAAKSSYEFVVISEGH